MNEKEDCPVDEKTCVARMETLKGEIKNIKTVFIVVGSLLGIEIGLLGVVLKLVLKQ